MALNIILYGYLILLGVQVAIELTLEILNRRTIILNSSAPPAELANAVDQENYSRSVAYTLDKSSVAIFQITISSVVLAAFLTLGVLGDIESLLKSFLAHPYLHGVAFIFMIALIMGAIELPIRAYSIFVIEERYGFNTLTVVKWIGDLIKGLIVNIILLTPLLLGIFWFMDYAGSSWWLYAFGFVASFQLVAIYLFPVMIAPLFNTFTPLEDGELKSSILAMARDTGFRTSGIFVMDGSKRSKHANAYFTGFGKTKRIVLFDTLLNNLSTRQVVAVLAHEIGHSKMNHIPRMLLLSLGVTLIGFWMLSQLLQTPEIFSAFGLTAPSYHGALVLISLLSGPLIFFISPLISAVSRRFEYQSDAFSATAMKDSTPMVEALIALSQKSLSNLTPHRWYSFFHYSHPTLLERIRALSQASK
jgi:STE24 endopeptidase